jgi:hypothetical protein
MAMPMVLSHRGTPEPSSEIQRRLRQVHPRLELRYVDSVEAHWAICMRWAENDRRWAMIQSNEVDPLRSMDIIGYLPMDCDTEQAPAYLAKSLREYPADEVKQLVQQVAHYNDLSPAQQAVESAIAEVLDSSNPANQPKRRGRPPKVR